MNRMFASFLDFARPPTLRRERVDLSDLVGKVIDLVRPRARVQDVLIEFRPQGPMPVYADPQQIRQVLLNVLLNALDAQPGGGGISIAVGPDDQTQSPAWVVNVADKGPGIPPQVAETLFEPFVGTKETGVGLGLAICKRIIQSHGGTIEADTMPGGRSHALHLLAGGTSPRNRFRGCENMTTVLIVDDEPGVRFSLQRALSSLQVATITADTAKAGIQLVRADAPDLVLLDVRLPDMSGLDALQAIRSIDQRLPVIVMTAHGTTDTAIEATKRGAFDYLLKPFELPDLREAVQRGLEAGRLARRPHGPRPGRGDANRTGSHRRPERPDARGVQGDRTCGGLRRQRPPAGGKRCREGTRRPGYLSA